MANETSRNKSSENVDKNQINCLEKRFDDYKKYSNWIGGSISLIIAAIIVLFGLNLKSEKDSLIKYKDDLKNEIYEALGKGEKNPKLILCDNRGASIEDGVLDGILDTSITKNKIHLTVPFIVKNIGNSISGEIWIKSYANEPLAFGWKATEEPSYKWFYQFRPEEHSLGIIPGGGYTSHYGIVLSIWSDRKNKIKEELYPFMIKMYYGNGLVTECSFKINIHYGKVQ